MQRADPGSLVSRKNQESEGFGPHRVAARERVRVEQSLASPAAILR